MFAEAGLLLVTIAAGASLLMVLLYLVQRATGDGGIADVGWAFGLVAAAIYLALEASGDPVRRTVLAVLAGVWGGRLGCYILIDRVLKGEEDGRYRRMREYWGEKAQPFMFLFFQAQAIFIVLFSIPFLGVALHPGGASPLWIWIGFAIWVVAVAGESIADRQLARFRADPDTGGKVCRLGLWRYSRHPNYFFEWLHWWAYCALGMGAMSGWLTLFGPVVMLLFLFRLTGIPYTEQQALSSRGEAYREYQRSTSAFIPWFPKTN